MYQTSPHETNESTPQMYNRSNIYQTYINHAETQIKMHAYKIARQPTFQLPQNALRRHNCKQQTCYRVEKCMICVNSRSQCSGSKWRAVVDYRKATIELPLEGFRVGSLIFHCLCIKPYKALGRHNKVSYSRFVGRLPRVS